MTRRKACPKCRKFNAYRKIDDEEGRPAYRCENCGFSATGISFVQLSIIKG